MPTATGPFTADANRGELVEQLLDVHRALVLIVAAAPVAANHEDRFDVGEMVDAIEQLARETGARVWALQETLPSEMASWEPGDEPPPATSDAHEPRLRAVPSIQESAS